MTSDLPDGWSSGPLGEYATEWKRTWKPTESTDQVVAHYSIPAFDQDERPTLDPPATIKSNKLIVPEDAVLVSRLNPAIQRVWTPLVQQDLLSVCSTEMVVLRPGPGTDRRFLHYLCRSDAVYHGMCSATGGTTGSRQRVAAKDVLTIAVAIPPVREQQAIAEVLGALDERIDWCRATTGLARQLQQAVFAMSAGRFQWVPLDDVAYLDKGVSYKGEGVVDGPPALPLINLGLFGRDPAPRWDNLKYYAGETKPRHHVAPGDVVICATDMTPDRLVLGRPLVVPERLPDAAITHHLYVVRQRDDAPALESLLVSLALGNEATRREIAEHANGTTVLALPKRAVLEVKVPLPDEGASPVVDVLWILQRYAEEAYEQRRTLIGLRDSLLARLLSGEVRVDPEEVLEAV